MDVQLSPESLSDLGKLDAGIVKRIVKRLGWLAENFDSITPDQLTGNLGDLYKYRVGDYRVLYDLTDDDTVIYVHRIGHRRNVYD